MKKTLSLILAVLMIVATMPMALAAEEGAPVLIDPINDPPIATAVEAGARLSTSTLSGGAVKHPTTGEPLTGTVWKWVSSRTKVNEAGYYQAYCGSSELTQPLKIDVYVAIIGNAVATEINSVPLISEIIYDGHTTYGDISLADFVATEKGTDIKVEGIFSIQYETSVIEAGNHTVKIFFTPNDAEKYLPCETSIDITVNPAKVNFVDENGNAIVPEITLDKALKVGSDLDGYLKSYLNAAASFNWEETAGYGEMLKPGTSELTVKTICDNTNYERYNTLTFKVNVNKQKMDAKIKNVVDGQQIYFEGGDVIALKGDFTVTYFFNGEKLGVLENVKLNQAFAIPMDKTGTYSCTAVYNGTADDFYDVTVIAPDPINFVLKYKATIEGKSAEYAAGETVTAVAATPSNFVRWNITDTSGNPINVAITSGSLESYSIAFLMPEYDIVLSPEYKSADSGSGDIDIGIGDIDGIDGFLAWLKNLIEKIKGIFETIIEFFQSIGDMT